MKTRQKPIKILHLEKVKNKAKKVEKEISKSDFKFEYKQVSTKKQFLSSIKDWGADILLANYNYPEQSGEKILKDSLAISKSIPFVFITNEVKTDNAVGLIKKGAADLVLQKNLNRLPVIILRFLKESETTARLEANEEFTKNILSSLSSCIAVVNKRGNIISTNNAWKKLTRKFKSGYLGGLTEGSNYLEIYSAVKESENTEALNIFKGIKSVLQGEKKIFTQDYFCHSSHEKKWFNIRAVPFEGGDGAVITQEDISSLKLADEKEKTLSSKLKERVKEQSLLYKVNKKLQESDSINYTLKNIVNDIPSGMQFPEISVAKINFKGQHFINSGYKPPVHKLESSFKTFKEDKGLIEVGYTKKPESGNNPVFMEEERRLIESLSEMICNFLEKKQAENELKNQKKFTESILNNIPADIAIFSPDHEYKYINKTSVDSNDLRNWLIGKSDFDYCRKRGINKELAKTRREHFNKAIRSKEEVEWIEKCGETKSKKYLLRRFYPIFEKGELDYVIGYGFEITERRKAELLVKESQLEQKLLADISQSLGKPISLKNSFMEILRKLSAFISADHAEAWLTNIDLTRLILTAQIPMSKSGESFVTDSQKIHITGTDEGLPRETWKKTEVLYWDDISNKKEFLRNEQAKNVGYNAAVGIPVVFNEKVIGLFILISKKNVSSLKKYDKLFQRLRKRLGAELKRKKSEEELDVFFNISPDLLCITDFKGKLKKINPSFAKLSGYTKRELLQVPFSKFIHHKDQKKTIKELKEVSKGKTTLYFENRIKTKSGEVKWLAWTAKSFRETGLIYAAGKDITDQKKLNKKLLSKQKNLTKAIVKAQEKERQELGKELHDNINQLLAAALIHLETLKTENGNCQQIANKSKKFIKKAINEARNLSHQMQIKDNITLKESIQYTINSINPENKKEVDFIYDGIDENDFSQDLKINLFRMVQAQLNNISQYAEAKKVMVSITNQNNNFHLHIKDDGKGFNPSKVNFGFGIKNIKNRTKMFNGDFKLIAAEGKGCEIKVEIPKAHSAAE